MRTAIRVRSRWFRGERRRPPAEVASAAAFIMWRVARHATQRMRQAGFDIDAGEPYFAFLAEFLAFAVAIADRIAHARLAAPARVEFTSALARHVGATLDDNARELLGAAPGATRARFVALVNERSAEYAHFAYSNDGAEFGFLRAFGTRLTDVLPEKDRPWTMAQVVEIEAPDVVATVAKAMANLLEAS